MTADAVRALTVGLLAGSAFFGCARKPSAEPPLEPQATRLVITAPSGAQVHVDGVMVGEAPLAQPIDASPGAHHIAVVQSGHEPSERVVRGERGRVNKITIRLDETAQRKWAWASIGVAGGGMIAGIVCGVLAVVEDRAIDDLEDGSSAISDATARRDAYRLAAGITAGSALALFAAGALLFAIDEPEVPKPKISAAPILSPDFVGAAAQVRF